MTSTWSTIVPNTDREDRGEIHRAFDPLIHPELGVYGCRTLYEGIRRGASLNPLGPCMGFRAVSTSGIATPFIYSSYSECLARIDALAAGLHHLNLIPPNSDGLKILGLYLKNCMEWVMAEHACYTIGGATCPFYDTLGPDTVQFILNQTETKTVVASRAQLPKLCEVKKSGTCPEFTSVILIDGVTQDAASRGDDAGLEVLSYAKVEAVGARIIATQGHKHTPPDPQDVATFCYTSGTTGNPKGALLTHENIISGIAGVYSACPSGEILPNDRHLSYLPLAHVFERVIMSQLFIVGASVAFYRGDPTLLIEDLQACRPTILPVAPRVLNKIYDKIQAGIANAGGFKKKLFDAAIAAKTAGLQRGVLTHPLYDRLIFNKIKKGLGMDKLRFMVSGSAPLSENVMIFFRCLLGIVIVEGYGQTEGSAVATIAHPDDIQGVGHVGGPKGCVEIALYDVPEMGYSHKDTEHRGKPCLGRGEICIRGTNVFKGYYREPEKTAEAIDKEGWLHSGDIGLWRPDGALQIIDRKKNIFKLSQGEYVAPEKIENILTRSALIGQCFVYGDSKESCLVALILPDQDVAIPWAKENAPEAGGFADLCKSPKLKDAIMDDIKRLGKENKLQGFEVPKAILLITEAFSVENDLLTPTFKLKRNKVRDQYEKEIEELYRSVSKPRSKL